MARLTTEERHDLPDKDFAWIDAGGGRHLPIENAEHVRDALSRWPVTHFTDCRAQKEARKNILEAARRFGIEVSPSDKIVRDEHDPPDACA